MKTRPATANDFAHYLRNIILSEGGLLLRLLIASLLSALLALALPHASRIALDSALPDASPRLLMVVAATVVVLVAHQAWLSWLSAVGSASLSAVAERRALSDVMAALLRCELAELRERDGGWMTTTLLGASSAACALVRSYATALLQGLFAIAYFVALAQASASAALLILGFQLAMAAASYAISRLEAEKIGFALDKEGSQRELLHVLLTSLPTVRGHCATERLAATWEGCVANAGRASFGVARLGVAMALSHSIGSRLLSVGFAVWGATQCLAGEISIGELVFLTSVANGLSGSLLSLVGVWTGLRALKPKFARIDEVLEKSQGSSPMQGATPAETQDAIVMDQVSFRYPGSQRWAVRSKSLRVMQGQRHHLEGASGSGKSTTLRLIAGLSRPTEGEIRIFGMDASQARTHVLYLPQHCKLFEASLRENLELLSGASLNRIVEVSRQTGLSDLVASLPMGLETHISAQGQNLSSGQRQLVALTAAFASSRSVLLLDEATSQVDAMARSRIQWDTLCKGRTVVIVEHG